MHPQYHNLEQVIRYLHEHGETDDFTADGLPKVSVVNKYYTKDATRDEIDKTWYKIFGTSTWREKKPFREKTITPTIYSNENFRRAALTTIDNFTNNLRESESLLRTILSRKIAPYDNTFKRLDELHEIQEETTYEYKHYNQGDTDLDEAKCKTLIEKSKTVQYEIDILVDQLWDKSKIIVGLNISPGDRIQMTSFYEPVREYIVLETEVAENCLNALLYDTQDTRENFRKRIQWWYLYESGQRSWRVEKTRNGKKVWERVVQPTDIESEIPPECLEPPINFMPGDIGHPDNIKESQYE